MKSVRVLAVLMGMLVNVGVVFAAGDQVQTREVCTTTYGGGTTCETVEIPQEKVVHTPVETGLVENVILAIGLFVAGYLVLLLAKRYEVVK